VATGIEIANATNLPPVAEWPEHYVYVGRRNNRRGLKASPLANPFTPEACSEDKRVNPDVYCLLLYLRALEVTSGDVQSAECQELARLRGIHEKHGRLTLVCWCVNWNGEGDAPNKCHAEVVKAFLEEV
jgi:hypothetical protein